jgi:hypothetical protein
MSRAVVAIHMDLKITSTSGIDAETPSFSINKPKINIRWTAIKAPKCPTKKML